MQHFFVNTNNINDNMIMISGSDYNHIVNVLRIKKGEEVVIVCDDNSSYICEFDYSDDLNAYFKVISEAPSTELKTEIILYQGLPKGDKFETVIQKAVELGVSKIIPVDMKRCIAKIDPKKSDSKIKRWNAISESASKQSGRGIIPKVSGIVSLKQAISDCTDCEIIVPYESENGMHSLKSVIDNIDNYKKIAVFIGPEGGFEPDEITECINAGARIVSLGKRILRTETASLAIISMLMMHIEINSEE